MPNRIIKESICYSDDIDKLTPFEETVFYRLLVNCDDYGRFDARPEFMKSRLFATKQGVTAKNIEDAVSKLASVGLVRLYEVDEKPFLLFPKWAVHQRIRDAKPKWPEPISDDSPQLAATRGEPRPESNPIQSESNPNPKENSASAPVRFMTPTIEEVKTYCVERDNGIDAEQFFDFYQAKGWMVGKNKMKDWKACIRTWEQRRKDSNKPKEVKRDKHYVDEDYDITVV